MQSKELGKNFPTSQSFQLHVCLLFHFVLMCHRLLTKIVLCFVILCHPKAFYVTFSHSMSSYTNKKLLILSNPMSSCVILNSWKNGHILCMASHVILYDPVLFYVIHYSKKNALSFIILCPPILWKSGLILCHPLLFYVRFFS